MTSTYEQRRQQESWDRPTRTEHQLSRLNALLEAVLPHNSFYRQKLAGRSLPIRSLEELALLPWTEKDELIGDAASGGFAAHLTWPPDRYVRWHQTSGTRGRPLVVLDTAEDWQWWIDNWQFVLDVADVQPGDRAFMAFSFGPFIGFWSAYEAAALRGCLVIPGGGLNSLARLEALRASEANCLFCTPSYALHLAEVGHENQIDTATLGVRTLIVAGEPGGSVPAIRERLERAWAAQIIDHAGATEVGPWGYADPAGNGLHVLESEFIAEFIALDTGRPASDGELSELILTSLGRLGAPVIRYRTGDLVRPRFNPVGVNQFVFLEGGVVGRADDMLIIRGMNIFPSAIEQILHGFPEIVEYRLTATRSAELDQLTIEIEDRLAAPHRVAEELRLRLGLKIDIQTVPLGSLPRPEGKSRRFVDQRDLQAAEHHARRCLRTP